MSDLPAGIALQELRVFLALAEDPHFGRVGERLFLSQPHVSRTLAALERKVGGPLVDRSAHRLTALGQAVLAELRPAYDGLVAALDRARSAATGNGRALRLGCTSSIDSAVLTRLSAAYEQDGRRLDIVEINSGSPYRLLTDGEVDVIAWLRSGTDPALVIGPTIEVHELVVAMGSQHPLAAKESVSADDVAAYDFMVPSYDGQPTGFGTDLPSPTTVEGREIPRQGTSARLFHEVAYDLARSTRLFPVLSGAARAYGYRTDLAFRPLLGAPPLEIALTWLRTSEDDRIRALAAAAEELAAADA